MFKYSNIQIFKCSNTNIVQMFWPTVVSHKIDDESPLWEFSARNIARFQYYKYQILEILPGFSQIMNTYRNISSNPPACQELYLAKMPKLPLWSSHFSAKPLKSSWLWRASLPRQGTQSRWSHSTNSFVRKSFNMDSNRSNMDLIWIHYKSNMDPIHSDMDAASRFALPTCRMKSSGGLGEPEIFYS